MSTPYRIDVHAHFPVDLHATPGSGGPPWAVWDTASAVQWLDRLQIMRQYLSLPVLPSDGAGAGSALGFARTVNNRFAAIIEEEPARFGAFAMVPGEGIEDALAEARRAVDVLGLHGIGLPSNSEGRYLGDPWFEPLFALAEDRGVPVFVHPALNPQAAPLTLGRPAFLVEFPVDTFRSLVDAIYAGVLDRHPDLTIIAAHCGGALPSLAWRVSSLAGLTTRDGGRTSDEIAAALGKLYLDTALSGAGEVLRSAMAIVGETHLLYGTDSGAAPEHIIDANDEAMSDAGLTPAQFAGIESGNAARLFPETR